MFVSNKKILLFVISKISILTAEVVHCPKLHVESVDMDRYAGTWYTYQQSCNDCEKLSKCSKAIWSKPDQAGNSTVMMSEFSEITFNHSEVTSTAYIEGKKLISVLYVPSIEAIKLEYWILATDYNTYSIVYSCKVDKSKLVTEGIVYTRTRQTDFNMTVIAQNVYNFQKIKMPTMIKINQENCS